MSENKFLVVAGAFICKACKANISSARFWYSSGDVSWICESKHISTVGLVPKKKKKSDFDE